MKKLPCIAKKAGFTLAELVVVMTLTGIMAAMVVSFTVLVNGWSRTGTDRYNMVQSLRVAEYSLRNFISAYDSKDYYFAINEDGNKLEVHRVDAPHQKKTLYLNGNVLTYEMPDAVLGEIALDHIVTMKLVVRTNSDGRQLITMRLYYSLPKTTANVANMSGSYDILVCTRATSGGAA